MCNKNLIVHILLIVFSNNGFNKKFNEKKLSNKTNSFSICSGFLHDDGYMIECDHCKVWQHVRCVIKNKQVPEEYLCEVCDPTKSVDRSKARLLQQQWMRDMQLAAEVKLRKEGKFKEHPKSKDILSETDSSDGEHMGKFNVY